MTEEQAGFLQNGRALRAQSKSEMAIVGNDGFGLMYAGTVGTLRHITDFADSRVALLRHSCYEFEADDGTKVTYTSRHEVEKNFSIIA